MISDALFWLHQALTHVCTYSTYYTHLHADNENKSFLKELALGSGLQIKFQDSQSYTVKPCLGEKKENKKD